MKLAALLCLSTLACARVFPSTKEVIIDHFGVNPQTLVVRPNTDLRFVNRDKGPHHMFSQDCPELTSEYLYPLSEYTALLGDRPKLCHFHDLVEPGRAGYSGTLEVRD